MDVNKGKVKGYVSMVDGGCWYCERDFGRMVFSWEWDCNVHLECIRKRLDDDPRDEEAQLFDEEFHVKYVL
tara:strand:+ start:428 stop:640 length:213 start_codon:yes stop_codon:yes gene_type:complete